MDGKNIPEIPPSVKVTKNPSAHKVRAIDKRTSVHSFQPIEDLVPVGTATNIVVSIVTNLSDGDIPEVNTWCPYTMKATTPPCHYDPSSDIQR